MMQNFVHTFVKLVNNSWGNQFIEIVIFSIFIPIFDVKKVAISI